MWHLLWLIWLHLCHCDYISVILISWSLGGENHITPSILFRNCKIPHTRQVGSDCKLMVGVVLYVMLQVHYIFVTLLLHLCYIFVTINYYIFVTNLLHLLNISKKIFCKNFTRKNCKIKIISLFQIKLKYISNLKLKYQIIFDIPFQKKIKREAASISTV